MHAIGLLKVGACASIMYRLSLDDEF